MSSSTFGRKAGVLIAGTSVYGVAVYMAYNYLQMSSKFDDNKATAGEIGLQRRASDFSFVKSAERNQQYQRIADFYDDQIGRDEFFMGINLLRRSLLYWHASGTVLEVGAGTGRNLNYYKSSNTVNRVVLADQSDQMLAQAQQKIAAFKPSQQKRFATLEADAANLNVPVNTFDTVVDTFGLCSYDDPVQVLKEMARVCKPTGKILLLEHGRSAGWDFVTNHLDKHAETHAKNWGCVWNRDLDAVIERSGLKIERLHKFHFGTTYYVVCRPVPDTKQA
jgi:methyltransferase OMS1